MQIKIHYWNTLTDEEQLKLLERPAALLDDALRGGVADIIRLVREGGDAALRDLTQRFDGVSIGEFRVTQAEVDAADNELSAASVAAIETAIRHVRCFHEAQLPRASSVETMPGIVCERLPRPVDCAGLYVPAGSAPLPSTVVMLAVPAAIAGCPRRVICTPPRPDGRADPSVLVAARRCGITEVYKIGGAQAIAAMAYGTESIPKADKLFGPGNAWVTTAKSLVAAGPQGPAIDMPAGPSEVLVIADAHADASFVAADLLSQAEHGNDSQVVLVTTDAGVAARVAEQIEIQLPDLERRSLAAAAIVESRFIVAGSADEAADISNAYAPEHLILQIKAPRALLPKIRNAGSVFLGPWSPESAGDYCSGTNHVLPTGGRARSYSGLSVEDFMRMMTVQELSEDGLRSIAGAVIELANLEGLDAHAEAVKLRLATAGSSGSTN